MQAGGLFVWRRTISRGEKVALIGRNGAGRTTRLPSLVRNAPGPIDAAEQAFAIDAGIRAASGSDKRETRFRLIHFLDTFPQMHFPREAMTPETLSLCRRQ